MTSAFCCESSLEQAVWRSEAKDSMFCVQVSKDGTVLHVPNKRVLSPERFVWACYGMQHEREILEQKGEGRKREKSQPQHDTIQLLLVIIVESEAKGKNHKHGK